MEINPNMKTAGALLREKRIEKELSIEDVARRLKVRPEYLLAVESNDYQKLPSATVAKGFLKNYARVLYLNPETILAMFRRDFVENEKGEIIWKGALTPLAHKPRLISASHLIFLLGLVVFCIFLAWQIMAWRSLPKLEVIDPINGEVYAGKVIVRGSTDLDAVVSINNQKIMVDPNGNFSLELALPKGTHSIVVEAQSRSGQKRLIERTFQTSD